jgi:hypothetical protein
MNQEDVFESNANMMGISAFINQIEGIGQQRKLVPPSP